MPLLREKRCRKKIEKLQSAGQSSASSEPGTALGRDMMQGRALNKFTSSVWCRVYRHQLWSTEFNPRAASLSFWSKLQIINGSIFLHRARQGFLPHRCRQSLRVFLCLETLRPSFSPEPVRVRHKSKGTPQRDLPGLPGGPDRVLAAPPFSDRPSLRALILFVLGRQGWQRSFPAQDRPRFR